MSGYIGAKQGVTQVDGYNRSEADAEFVNDPNDVITVSGSNVGIGTSSPNNPLTVVTDSAANGINIVGRSSDDRAYIFFSENDGNTFTGSIHTIPSANRFNFNAYAGNNMTFSVDGAEKARIDPSGNLLVGRTSQIVGGKVCIDYTNGVTAGMAIKDTLSSGTGVPMQIVNGSGTIVGSITQNQSSTAFNTTSDYRLKENVVPLAGAADRLAQIPVHRFNFIADPEKTVDGFLAHEVQAFVPEAVTGEKDAMRLEQYEVEPAVYDDEGNLVSEAVMGEREVPDYQGIDQSKLVPLLTAALQEALQKIDALEARVATLEGGAA